MRVTLLITIVGFWFSSFAQGTFPGVVGDSSTDAIHKDSVIIQGWATHCSIHRGWQDITNKNLGKATVGDSSLALGKALSNGVVSLGDSGIAVLEFNGLIYDGPGPDFAVFENSFSNTFLELAHVEVSSDGQNFFRFPSSSLSDTTTQIGGFGNVDARNLHNLAGKYVAGYGTPFDLGELSATAGLDIQNISHIRIIDVIGSLTDSICSRDATARKINDPYPTPFPSSGFDLDAVGAIYMKAVGIEAMSTLSVEIYPNPANSSIRIKGLELSGWEYQMFGLDGALKESGKIVESSIDVSRLSRGQYILRLIGPDQIINKKVILID